LAVSPAWYWKDVARALIAPTPAVLAARRGRPIRLTTTVRDLPTWMKLSPADPLTGYANADCIEQLGKDSLGEYLGVLSAASMRAVNQALAIALALS
jgi:mRNA-degrading endonuclease toxin of MazEF toxin-antitoxin module